MTNDIDNLKKRLIYRSKYRGTKEMDKLIGSFVKSYIDHLDTKDLKDLEQFLNTDDETLYKFYNNQIVETKIIETKIVKLYKEFVYKK
jgi:antitoxin CptB